MKIYLLIPVLIGLIGCSDPYSYSLSPSPESWANDAKLKKSIEKLSEDEKELLTGYMMRTMFNGEAISPLGISIREAIDSQASWKEEKRIQEEEMTALAAKIEAEIKEKRDKLLEVVTVALVTKEFRAANYSYNRYSDTIAITVAFQNKSDKDISGIKGSMALNDMFGESIKVIGLSYDDGVSAGKTVSWKGELDYNQFMAKDVKLATTPTEKMKVEWHPQTIIYSDGTVLDLN